MTKDREKACHLVFLNGWSASSAMLDGFKSQLPANYELTILDNLYQFELTEIVAKIDKLVTTNTVLVGWSLGGMLVLYYASLNLNSPKAKAFILLNSSACFLERHDYKEGVRYKEFDSLKQVVQAHDSKTLVRLFTHLLVDGSLSLKDDRRLLKQVYNVGSLAGWKVLSKGLDYLEALDLRAMLNAIQLPVLWVLGEKDVLISASSGDALAEKNTGFTVKTIPGMGHYPFGIFAEKVTAIIVDYVSSLNENKNSVSKS